MSKSGVGSVLLTIAAAFLLLRAAPPAGSLNSIGMTLVTIEPGIYRPGWGGVRIEDDVHLSTGATEVLTRFTRELLVVG